MDPKPSVVKRTNEIIKDHKSSSESQNQKYPQARGHRLPLHPVEFVGTGDDKKVERPCRSE